jgi:hypothetical protein
MIGHRIVGALALSVVSALLCDQHRLGSIARLWENYDISDGPIGPYIASRPRMFHGARFGCSRGCRRCRFATAEGGGPPVSVYAVGVTDVSWRPCWTAQAATWARLCSPNRFITRCT